MDARHDPEPAPETTTTGQPDPAVMAVHAVDDQTRTASGDPDETDTVQAGPALTRLEGEPGRQRPVREDDAEPSSRRFPGNAPGSQGRSAENS